MSKHLCSYCKTVIGKKLLSKNSPAPDELVSLINALTRKDNEGYCQTCLPTIIKKEEENTRRAISEIIDAIPVITIHTPQSWNYEILGIVTGQSTTGTGIFSDIESSISDFFGGQSVTYNAKIAEGETRCFSQLRAKASALGGNAVIATDIDYSELGTSTGMIMVCASGTAIKLMNIEILGEEKTRRIHRVQKMVNYLNKINSDGAEVIGKIDSFIYNCVSGY